MPDEYDDQRENDPVEQWLRSVPPPTPLADAAFTAGVMEQVAVQSQKSIAARKTWSIMGALAGTSVFIVSMRGELDGAAQMERMLQVLHPAVSHHWAELTLAFALVAASMVYANWRRLPLFR